MLSDLSKRQRETLDAITRFIAEKQHSPSFEEIGRLIGLRSVSTVYKHVGQLHAKGYINHRPGHARSISIVEDLRCPHCRKSLAKLLLPRKRPAHVTLAQREAREGG